MAEVGDVTLNIYKLSNNNNGINTNTGNFCNWTSRLLLPAIGMGAYHTSITVAGTTTTYTFAAQHGIVQSRSKSEGDTIAAAAAMMVFQESLFLGYCRLNRGQVQEIIQRLNIPFAENSYHLVHRNCNHFTETLATALLKYEELMEAGGQQKLSSANTVYPVYINRLANTSSVFIGHDEDIVPCNILQEATLAVGADHKVGWSLAQSKPSSKPEHNKVRQDKKTLTDAQKKALAKIRKS